jgi:hypothetical protein
MGKGSKQHVQVGQKVSADELKQLSDLRESLKPEASWNRLDAFGKWIFSAVATVGVLGAGFSNSAFQQLSIGGKAAFSLAIALVGLALALTVRGLTPQLMSVSTSSIDSMRDAISGHIRRRQRALEWAGILLGFALVLASFAPMLSSVAEKKVKETPGLAITYTLGGDGKLSVEAQGYGLAPLTPVEAALIAKPSIKALPRARGIAGTDGKVLLKLELTGANKLKSRLYAAGGWGALPGASENVLAENHQDFEIPLR